jgi:hypothetical protein
VKKIDFHTHSHYSDGTSRPEDLSRRAGKAGLELLILTDHDTVAGFPELLESAKLYKVSVACGIEINTADSGVHILGYGFKWDSPLLMETLSDFRARRRLRVEKMLEKLRSLGFPIDLEDVGEVSKESLGRPHIADALVKKGLVKSRQEAFDRLLSGGKPGYVESLGPSPKEAIELIRGFGGFASLAHPHIVKKSERITEWIEWGLEGLEGYYADLNHPQKWRDLAKEKNLLLTGGSDFHGPGSGRDKVFGVEIPDEVYQGFLKRLEACPDGIYRA